jgi:hypothetical protein
LCANSVQTGGSPDRGRLLKGCRVIGDFRYSGRPDGKGIYVHMRWGPRRQRLARIALPSRVQARLEALDYPSLNEEMGLEAGLSYAIFIGMRIGLAVYLAGDSSVWNPMWGRLDAVEPEHHVDAGIPAVLN